ncbi:hypothetical protein V8E52_009433 [Russula decolorans]
MHGVVDKVGGLNSITKPFSDDLIDNGLVFYFTSQSINYASNHPGEDDWPILNGMLKTAFGWGEAEMAAAIPDMLNRGALGLDGFIEFMRFFVNGRGLEGVLIETKINALLKKLGNQYPSRTTAQTAAHISKSVLPATQEIIDVDAIRDGTLSGIDNPTQTHHPRHPRGSCGPRKCPCKGILIEFPDGKDEHTSYPFGLHKERTLPWNYRSVDDSFYIQAKSCQKWSSEARKPCQEFYTGVIHRIMDGTHENVPLVYHGIGGLMTIVQRKTDQIAQLRMSKLNDSRKLLAKAGVLEDHKQLILAIASGRVERVAPLVQAALKNGAGIGTIIQQYERAAEKLYKPKGYTNEDIMRSIVLLRLGGARVAEFAHRSLALLSLTTIRRNTVLPTLVVSHSTPTLTDIQTNILSCYSAFGTEQFSSSQSTIVHQVIMLDEIAIEKRVRWDDSTNKFQGTCREHNSRIPLDFGSEKELDLLCEALEKDNVHLATEATVAAIGLLSSDPRMYAARPILFSGTCKKEKSEEHAQLIKLLLNACNKQKTRNNTTYRTICIALDGEAKRGDALAILAMTSDLSVDSPIYAQLRPLEFMNLLVGPDDITADKDPKHIIKRQRNVFMRKKGVSILDFRITPSILCTHLESNGDVLLAYSLMKEIWSLPPPPAHSNPSFAQARRALNLYGEFARNLVLPYVCIDLSLDKQLIHLSAAAHLAFHCYRHNSAGTSFMPAQSYTDIILMVKNAYFCVAKTKVDNPRGKFYLISLGTDRLETFFGLIRTAVGTDANVDMLQLGSRASGLTEVAVILAEHPEWDYGTRRLMLPVFSKAEGNFTSKADHINPRDWRGDVSVANVNLHSCWLIGRKRASELIPDMESVLDALSGNDMLSPLGKLLVNQRDDDDDSLDPGNPLPAEQRRHHGTTSIPSPSLPYTHDGDLEDALADEAPRDNVTSEIVIQGQRTSKAKALRHRMAYNTSRSSTDRLKRVQQVPCFDAAGSFTDMNSIISSDSLLGNPCLRIGNPIAILVRCEGMIVMAIAQVSRLKFTSRDNILELPIHLLTDPTAKVDAQILCLRRATIEDDPTQVHDWCWSLKMGALCDDILGQYVHPINPSVSVHQPGNPTFLFEGAFLITLACGLFQELAPHERKNLPKVKLSDSFPY